MIFDVSRAQWGARPWKGRTAIRSAQSITAHYTATDERLSANSTIAEEAKEIRGHQNFHIDGRGWNDLAYNFAIGQSGRSYEARGVGIRSAAQGTNTGNDTSYAAVFLIGPNEKLTDQAVQGFLKLRDALGLSTVRVHSDWKPTGCPGDNVRALRAAGAFDAPVEVAVDDDCCDLTLTKTKRIRWLQAALGGLTIDGDFGPKSQARFDENWLGDRCEATAELDKLLINKPSVVRWLQRELNSKTEMKSDLRLDGHYGQETAKVVSEIDPGNGLGIVTSSTITRLLA